MKRRFLYQQLGSAMLCFKSVECERDSLPPIALIEHDGCGNWGAVWVIRLLYQPIFFQHGTQILLRNHLIYILIAIQLVHIHIPL